MLRLAVGEVEIAVLVEIADVAERRPAVAAIGGFGLGGIVAIGEGRPAVEIDDAVDARRQGLARLLVDDADMADKGASDRAAMGEPFLRSDDRDAVAFGAGVIFDENRPPPVDHLLLDLDRTGRGGVNGAAQRVEMSYLSRTSFGSFRSLTNIVGTSWLCVARYFSTKCR